jgi:hypothetical protein
MSRGKTHFYKYYINICAKKQQKLSIALCLVVIFYALEKSSRSCFATSERLYMFFIFPADILRPREPQQLRLPQQ